jgi:hypothetical protein
MPQNLTCYSCRKPLVIANEAPAEVSCPHCLATIENPRQARPPHSPMRVIPFDQEVRNDLLGSNRTIVLLSVGWVIVAFVAAHDGRVGLAALLIAAAILFASISAFVNRERVHWAERIDDTPTEVAPSAGGVLSYARPPRDRTGTAGMLLRFLGGFFIGLAICVGSMFLLGASYDAARTSGARPVVVGVVGAVYLTIGIAAITSDRKGILIGLGRGISVGLVLGLMALGPCALCYLGF